MSFSRPSRPRHRMIDRAAEIMEAAARSERGLTLTDFASQLGAPLSTIQSLVNGLTAAGFLVEARKRFELGPAPYLLGAMAGRPPVRSVNHNALQALHHDSGQPVVLAVYMSQAIYYIDTVGDLAQFEYLTDKVVSRPPFRSSCGRAILATFDKRNLWDLIEAQPASEAEAVQSFLAELPDIRARELAYAPGLTGSRLHGVATPVREDDRTVGAVAIIGAASVLLGQKTRFEALLLQHRQNWPST